MAITNLNTAMYELTTGSNTPPTDSTDLRLTMQHKSGTAFGVTEGTGKPRMISHQFAVALQGKKERKKDRLCQQGNPLQRVHVSNVPPHFPHPKPQVSSAI